MQAKVINYQEFTVLVEYEDSKGLQRVYVPRDLIHSSIKGPITLKDEILKTGIPYSDVDLEHALGTELPAILVRDLEQELRKSGLWTREDYRNNPKVVEGVVARIRRLDSTTILNSAIGEKYG